MEIGLAQAISKDQGFSGPAIQSCFIRAGRLMREQLGSYEPRMLLATLAESEKNARELPEKVKQYSADNPLRFHTSMRECLAWVEECGHVYKDLNSVLAVLEAEGVARVAHRLYPVANIKGAE
jgi:RNA-splicing ligase RtcB